MRSKILVVGHLYWLHGRKHLLVKLDAIKETKEEYKSKMEVRQILGAFACYHICTHYYAHIIDALYGQLNRGQKFKWEEAHRDNEKVEGDVTNDANIEEGHVQRYNFDRDWVGYQ